MVTRYHKVRITLGVIVFLLFAFLLFGGVKNVPDQEEIAVTTESDEARTLFLKGRALNENVRGDEARELFMQAVAKDPGFALAHLYRAFTATSAGDFQNHLEKAVELAPNASEGERLLIETVEANVDNDAVKAIELSEQLVMKFPNDKRARQFLGGVYAGEDKDDKAIVEFEKAIAIDQNFAPAYNSLGYAYIQKENYEAAEKSFKHYISLIPQEANPHDSIADLYTKMGRHDEAIVHYKKAIELNPKFSMSQRKIGANLIFSGQYAAGREALLKAMDMETTPAGHVTDQNQIALSYIYQGDHKQALTEFNKSIQMAADAGLQARVADIHSQKCFVNIESGDLKAATQSLAECKKVVMASDLRPSFKNNFAKGALFQEALIAAKQQDYKAAMTKADEHLARIQEDNDPTEIENHHDLLGHIYFEKGDFSKAVEHFRQGDQEEPYTLYRLALSESKVGDPAKASELMQKVASWNQNSLSYAFIRSEAIEAAKKKVSVK